jgi:hypothetical protein
LGDEELVVSDMRVNNLNVDLLQDQATVALFKQDSSSPPGKVFITAVNIQVPIPAAGNLSDTNLKRTAIEAAKRALDEAIQVLNNYKP